MFKLENGKTLITHNNYFDNSIKKYSTEEITSKKIMDLNASQLMHYESSKQILGDDLKEENDKSTRLNAWAELRGYTYHPIIEVWINDKKDLKTEEDFEKELAVYKILKENGEEVTDFQHFDHADMTKFQNFDTQFAAADFSLTEDFQSTCNSMSSTSTTTTSSVSSVSRVRHPTSVFPSVNDEMEVPENSTMGFEFDPTSGNWINHYGITLTSEELSFNIEENKNLEKLAANLNTNQLAEETFRIREQREKNEARVAKEMAEGLGCSFAYPQPELLPISVMLENLIPYQQQIKAKYHKDAPSLIEAGKFCGYVYRSQMGYWEHYKSGKTLDSDQLLRKYWIKSKTQLKNAGEF